MGDHDFADLLFGTTNNVDSPIDGILSCDYCGRTGDCTDIAPLDIEPGLERNLCKPCWGSEMVWRMDINEYTEGDSKYRIKNFPRK